MVALNRLRGLVMSFVDVDFELFQLLVLGLPTLQDLFGLSDV